MKSRNLRMSRRQEKSIARETGGQVQKASGATDFAKSDVRAAGELRVEAKVTSGRSFTLKLSELKKIQTEALMGGVEDYVMQVQFLGAAGQSKKFAVIDWHEYLELKELQKKAKEEERQRHEAFRCQHCGGQH